MPFQKLAKEQPGKPAAIMAGTGEQLSYGELERRSCQLAQLLKARGLRHGDRVAVLMENRLTWFIVAWGAKRAGLFVVPVNWHLKPAEARYIVEDSDSKAIITSDQLIGLAQEVIAGLTTITVKLVAGTALASFESLNMALSGHPCEPIQGALDGGVMPYSSGTSGKPKGISRAPSAALFGQPPLVENPFVELYRLHQDTVFLSPAPMYHSAPLGMSVMVQDVGGTMVLLDRFDAEEVLRAIESHRVTHGQFVPTHFTRMLALSPDVRKRYDLSSLVVVGHAAAPCPPAVKLAMMNWLGPVLYEFYGGSESFGMTFIGPQEWLQHPGSVGRGKIGEPHVVDAESGKELEPGAVGVVYFSGGGTSAYHKDEEKTRGATHALGWRTYGDLGRMDADGYLYLADRRGHLILSGGVNIYPQEVENTLMSHAGVADVAVIGVPNSDFGEEVKAVIVAQDPQSAGHHLATELIAFCRANLAHFKCPRSVDFVESLPRYPNGKLHKRELQERYWEQADKLKNSTPAKGAKVSHD